jgi:hypothetical protein
MGISIVGPNPLGLSGCAFTKVALNGFHAAFAGMFCQALICHFVAYSVDRGPISSVLADGLGSLLRCEAVGHFRILPFLCPHINTIA